MTLTSTAEQTARDLLNALNNGVIENYLEFVDARSGKDKFITLLPISGVLNDDLFSIPSFYALQELAANRLIDLSQGTTSRGGTKWTVLLTGSLHQLFEPKPAEASETQEFEIIKQLPRIFVSYSRADSEIRDHLVGRLRKAYDEVWADDKLTGGVEWWKEILYRIQSSDIFLYLLSRDSISSVPCRAEFSEAVRQRKQIIPILVDSKLQIPKFISMYQFVNMANTTEKPDSIADLFAATIKTTLKISQKPNKPVWSQASSHPSESVYLKVYANKEPMLVEDELNTGVFLIPGDKLTIQAKGKVSVDNEVNWMTPHGFYPHPDQRDKIIFYANPDAYQTKKYPQELEQYDGIGLSGSLFGWIGEKNYEYGNSFFVGEHLQRVIEYGEEGFLYLAVNDSRGHYSDNSGAFDVTISIQQRD